MKAYLDIENSRTQQVTTLEVDIIESVKDDLFVFDLSNITSNEMEQLIDAINESKEYFYTDIEMFFVDNKISPCFGDDYKYEIKGNRLYAVNTRKEWEKRMKEQGLK